MKFPNISLGRSSKTYTHDMSFDNNTTYPFGVVQPLLSQRLDANSHINVNMRQLVRLAPMPVPTFARLFSNNEVFFVPTTEVCPYYEAFLSQQSYRGSSKTYFPTELPKTSNSYLLYYLLTTPDLSQWVVYDTLGNRQLTVDSLVSTFNAKLANLFFNSLSSFKLNTDSFVSNKHIFISVDSADFTIALEGTTNYVLCFKLTPKGRRLRSNILGLGYSLNVDNDSVSLIPLLSYYKAWFDFYHPTRTIAWTDTNAFQLIKVIEDYTTTFKFPNAHSHSNDFDTFLNDLADTFFVAKDDIVSVHRESVNLSSVDTLPDGNIFDSDNNNLGDKDIYQFEQGEYPQLATNNGFGLIALQALQRFTRYFSKNSVLGHRISEYLKVHYGAQVANSLYKDAHHVHSFSYPLNVDDLFSTSDTFDVVGDTSKGELLGSYAGKGIGFDKSSFNFTAPSDGYLFVLGSISTPISYFQGNSGDLYVTDFDTTPVIDFDALGYEISPKGQFFGDNGQSIFTEKNVPTIDFSSGFGFVPRFTGLKYHKNIVNGDISRKSTASSLSAYHLNRIVTPNHIGQKAFDSSVDGGKCNWYLEHTDIPAANPLYRYLSQYEWLGNYNRIFYNDSVLFPNSPWQEPSFGSDDNFIIQTVFDSKVTNKLKPLSQSWDTYEESKDDSSIDVSPE